MVDLFIARLYICRSDFFGCFFKLSVVVFVASCKIFALRKIFNYVQFILLISYLFNY